MTRLLHICSENAYVSANYAVILFSIDLNLPLSTPQTTIFGFLVETDKCIFKISNQLPLIFKMYIYEIREKESVILIGLINDKKKLVIYNKKWEKIKHRQQ